MFAENEEMSGKKNSRKKDGGDISTVLDKLANVALCLVGISVPCFVFDAFWWGIAALAVAAVIILAITAIFLFGAVFTAKALKDIPHR